MITREEILPFVILFMFLAAWPLYLLLKAEYRRIKNNRSPEIRTKAVALHKEVTSGNIQYSDSYMRDDTIFYCTFLLRDGNEIRLFMNGRNFVSFEEGDEGELLYKGSRMLNFTADIKKENLE